MDTTQKTREEAVRQTARKAASLSQGKTPPPSAQQNNGAARTEQEQRTAAAKPRPAQSENAPGKTAPRRKASAPQPKRSAPAKKRTAAKADTEDVSLKKRSYGRTKPKKKTVFDKAGDVFKRTAQKQKSKKAGKKGASHHNQNTPAVIYTQPQAFNRNRFLIQMLTVAAIVLALVMGMSIFFKVETITVSGAEVYSAWAIREASGIEEGDNLLTFGQTRAGAVIQANLPYIREVRFGIKLPDTVNIIVEEEDVVYAVKDQNDSWWLMNSEGRIVEQTTSGKASNYTQILGITIEFPVANEKAIATEIVPTETDEMGELIPVLVTGAQKLNTALRIVQELEANGIVGDVASVDISRMEDIILWYGTRYQVNLGDSTRIDYKIACMNDVILQMSEWQSGILDISFTNLADQVMYTPFG